MNFQNFRHKRGDTLTLVGTVLLPSGTGAWTGTSRVVKQDGARTLVESLSVTLTPPAGAETRHGVEIRSSSTEAADWPLEKLMCDVRFQDQAAPPWVIHSPTFLIDVVEAIA